MFKALAVTVLFTLALPLSAARMHQIDFNPDTVIYADNLQWYRVDSEIKDFLKNRIVNKKSKSSLELYSEIKYQPYRLAVLSEEKVRIRLHDGREYLISDSQPLCTRVTDLLGLSCIKVRHLPGGYAEITRKILAESGTIQSASLHYSPASGGQWLNAQTVEMTRSFNQEMSVVSFVAKIKIKGTTEFAFRIYTQDYDFWDNNEGSNYSL